MVLPQPNLVSVAHGPEDSGGPSLSPDGPADYEIRRADAFEWLAQARPTSIHAVVTDPPGAFGGYRRPSTAANEARCPDSRFCRMSTRARCVIFSSALREA